MGGASALLITGSAPAKAGEERLHNSSFTVYGLIPPSESTKDAATRSNRAETTSAVRTASLGSSMKPGATRTASNEPKIEDPPMPTYDGPIDSASTMAGGSHISN